MTTLVLAVVTGVVEGAVGAILPWSSGPGGAPPSAASPSPFSQGTAPTGPRTPVGSPAAEGLVNDVDVIKLTDRGKLVDVTVRVNGPPATGTRYILVAHFRGQYQIKGEVPASIGTHVVTADIRLADPGSWRDFSIVGVNQAAAADWEASIDSALFELPDGTTELTDWKPHQMTR